MRKENKLMQSAIEDARKVYLWNEAGIEKETSSSDSFLGFGFLCELLYNYLLNSYLKIRKESLMNHITNFAESFMKLFQLGEKPLLAG